MSKRISLYIWCHGVEQRRHIAICMKEECACEVFLDKVDEIRNDGKKWNDVKAEEGEYRWSPEDLFRMQKI